MFCDEGPRIDHNYRSLGIYIGRLIRTSLVDKTRVKLFEHLAHVYILPLRCCNNFTFSFVVMQVLPILDDGR